MAPGKRSGGGPGGDFNFSNIGASLRNGTVNDRKEALDNLLFYFTKVDRRSQGSTQKQLNDKEYHGVLEALFSCTLLEKQVYFSTKKSSKTVSTAIARLEKCAECLRAVVSHGVAKIKRKTARAIIDHITQVLPGADDDFVEPLLQNYTKAFVALLDHPANVESFAVGDGEPWLLCVDFCLMAISRFLESSDRPSGSLSRASPAPGSGQTMSLAFSTGRSGSSSGLLRNPRQAGSQVAENYLSALNLLLSAPQAPFQERAKEITSTVLQVLQARHAKLSTMHQVAFATINSSLPFIHADNVSLAKSWARDLVPLITHWWPPRALLRDAMSNAIRDEILKTLYGIHLFLENLMQEASRGSLLQDLEDLLDTLWLEYSKREDRARLQLDDLTFTSMSLPAGHPETGVFSLRPYNPTAEQNWALLDGIAILESLHSCSLQKDRGQQPPEDEQPRKRRRVARDPDRILQKLTSPDPGVRLTALQLLPFLSHQRRFSVDEVTDCLEVFLTLISDKQAIVASWAMLACSSCAATESGRNDTLSSFWKQAWQIGVRSVSLPGTSRAACALLHSILESDLIPKHELVDEINVMVTNSDISGPAVLVDSSLVLMLHLLCLRNTVLPNASQATSSLIIRWAFAKWNPELIYASLHSHLGPPFDFVNLLRACCGMPVLKMPEPLRVFGGTIGQFWKSHKEHHEVLRYLLLLDEPSHVGSRALARGCSLGHDLEQVSDPTGSHTAKRLILELFFPKIEELVQMTDSWTRRGGEVTSPLSTERLQSVVISCLVGVQILPELSGLNSAMSRDIQPLVFGLIDTALKASLDSEHNDSYFEIFLAAVSPYIPRFTTAELRSLKDRNHFLLTFFAKLSDTVQERAARESSGENVDVMDVDNDFPESQTSQKSSTSNPPGLPRRDVHLGYTPEAFYLEAGLRLRLLSIIHVDDGQIGLVPESFVDDLLALPVEQLLCCRLLMQQLFASDLITTPDYATNVVATIGSIIGVKAFSYCEVALCTALEVMEGFISLWTDSKLEIASMVGDLYNHFVKYALAQGELSPAVQTSLSKLLFRLLEVRPIYASDINLPSCRSTLLSILHDGTMQVKYFIGKKLPKIFSLYVLKTHDDIFVDILQSLPADPEANEGIAFRLFALAELACNWSTLLRRCVYHIFETPGRIHRSARYAASCVRRISLSLKLDSPQELFNLFAPQLLYTWLDKDSIDDIPFETFGFPSLQHLLAQAQTEAAAIMIMRGQEQEAIGLAKSLGLAPAVMVKQSFTKIMAYSIAHDISAPKSPQYVTGESRVRKMLGKESFLESIYLNFVDIVATFFDIFDQEDPIEKYFRKDEEISYAADIMDEIKKCGHLDAGLPPNQQPMFKAKYLTRLLAHLCSRTEYEMQTLWTPSLVVAVTRSLLNTVHPSLGPLHACSVLRKIRVLICLAGPQVLASYPLEMLLHSIRTFIKDPECADDALGMSRYLIQNGTSHLKQAPSFLAGYALSSLADLRVFMESSQASTTQESQFRATMSKAQLFHSWFAQFLSTYDSPAFSDDDQRSAFKAITQSAANIRASGNAEKGTPESSLLLEILRDEERESQLLNRPAREVALDMLCGVFTIPQSSRLDVVETDEDALAHGPLVWKSCRSEKLSDEYLSWAGRVVGRSFAASGDLPIDILRESRQAEYRKLTAESSGSEYGILNLIQSLTVSSDCSTAGSAESALRTIVSDAVAEGDNGLLVACQKSLSEALLMSSNWDPYRTPPSDHSDADSPIETDLSDVKLLESPTWSQNVAIYLSRSVQNMVLLSVLPPILTKVNGFADQAFPFILHLVLLAQLEQQQGIKRQLSEALRGWLQCTSTAATENIKLLLNAILYLRTQPFPNESSIADRSNWLDVNFSTAAAAATRCGMYKVALLFAELASSETTRASRRSSSAVRDAEEAQEILLGIFENIDDPDAYYGLIQDASLATVLARLEYENDGNKSLAFRGAQYDSHLRQRDSMSGQDGQQLVKALSSLGLSGLSHSILQAHQSLDSASASLDSTFTLAQRLEIWNLPAPSNSDNNYAVTLYKAYQTMYKSDDLSVVREAVHDGLRQTIVHLASQSLGVSNLRGHLGTLAALTELDDLINITDNSELETMLGTFEERSKWMMSGRYADVSQILSCRETGLSMLSQQHRLRTSSVSPAQARSVQIRGMLLSSDIYRFHRATQESLNLSTSLTDLIQSSEAMGLSVDAAIGIEAANSLWDHGEMISSIRMLQSIDRDSPLKKQTVPVSRSNLLSKTGHQVSVARLESPDSIQKKYLEPALKELKGKCDGKEAGNVYHQFAMFCDEQLQNPDSLEDLSRLQHLKKGKSDEVEQLRTLIHSTKDTQLRTKYASHLAKAKQWLDLDQQELRRAEQTRGEFVKLSLENYLLSLIASDEHNNDALRFTAIWLERSGEDATNEAAAKYLEKVPTRKFASLMNQLSSRLQNQDTLFQKLLMSLVYHICVDHPYHGMYQIWSGCKARTNTKDEVAVSRQKATEKVAALLAKNRSVVSIWHAIDRTSRYYHQLAMDRDQSRYKAGQKMAIKDSPAGQSFLASLAKYPIPPPTLQIELSANMDYSHVPITHKFEPYMSIASGVSAPKIITAIGSDGGKYKQLVKGGNDDLRQDAIMEQVFAAVSELLKLHRTSRQRNLGIRTYKVLPLTSSSGLIEFVSNTIPLHEYLMPAHEKYYPKDYKGSHCRKEISNVQTKTTETRISTYRKVTERFHPVMRYFFIEYFPDPDEWFVKRTAYTRSTAAVSILGHVLGLGDRHGHNILLDTKTGEVVHIDLGVAFEMGRILPVPELVPFRMTRDIVDGMGITKTEGVFRRCCEFTLDALREETYSIMTILDVLRYDPLYSWSISPLRMAKLQNARGTDDNDVGDDQADAVNRKTVNEPSEADRALEVVRKKLSKTLSVTATVNDLINQATDERNLAVLYSGWAAYA